MFKYNKHFHLIKISLESLWNDVQGKTQWEAVGGPIYINQMAKKENRIASRYALIKMASSSTDIVLITLLPLPIFDGGHFIYLIIETVRKKRISIRTRRWFRIGSIILILALATVLLLDSFYRLLV